jgi:DnaJ-domain-containing protein 1
MGIFDRLGGVIKSYLNDGDAGLFGGASPDPLRDDPDMRAAFEELDDFLGGRRKDTPEEKDGAAGHRRSGGSAGRRDAAGPADVPESLRNDFAELGLPFGAPAEECKRAYKKLLKIHHPDRHAGHPGNFKKATEKTVRINAAWDRIEKWRETGVV